ncbi:deoxyuridine 5'-triphosphate nucleotidohydrolase, mitochondrial-like [Artibeus jamaicensis]|uniref:deoxyuridine 5'-triphosphate nucleotidohydrolase, mitochondrial-like n=1 Tax=Artibeus jamaicensis TaxID=9417 RepID=UPI00235AFF8F|nr:deoxyuridine 5'-triphosphate nucleotidohydrolase, mitochondrial-like [Artibeus jamaicensis]
MFLCGNMCLHSALPRHGLKRYTPSSPASSSFLHKKEAQGYSFFLLCKHTSTATKGSVQAAGHDLYSANHYIVPPMEKDLVKTDTHNALAAGGYGRVAPYSVLAAKHFLDVAGGVIDEDYGGNICLVLFNFGKGKSEIKKGDHVVQLICE